MKRIYNVFKDIEQPLAKLITEVDRSIGYPLNRKLCTTDLGISLTTLSMIMSGRGVVDNNIRFLQWLGYRFEITISTDGVLLEAESVTEWLERTLK